ncbi:hypothetical protein SAMN02910406_00909 [Ruminococcus albus]|uniref:Uncharacterized protein n=1 Tax=Ruminococcus albus TaxID=1264 RepID=A0A1I1F9B5_RUMAL|nr:hypothetical protein SAMN02910406_00909 [Ruminococcus albus]
MNRPTLCVQHKKAPMIIESSNKLASQFKRSQFCFELNALVIVKVYVIINELLCFCKSLYLHTVNAFGFEYRKEIFC